MKRSGVVLLVLAMMGCSVWQTGGSIGGANQNLKRPGNVAGGINLKNGDLAVRGTGGLFATMQDGELVSGAWGGNNMKRLDAMPDAQRMLFWTDQDGDGMWLAKAQNGSIAVSSWNSADDKVVWQRNVDVKPQSNDRFFIDVTQDGKYFVVTGSTMTVLDGATGETVSTYTPEQEIRDVDLTADGQYAIVTESNVEQDTSGAPETRVARVRLDDPSSKDSCAATANNCSSELVMAENDTKAFLAPTLCNWDPVSVFTFTEQGCKMEKQMPGFGPVALSPDGQTAVAFLDRDAFELDASGEQMQPPEGVGNSRDRFHLMFINVKDLSFTTKATGNDMPRYAFTPDGSELLVDTPMNPISTVRRLNVGKMKWTNMKGPFAKMHAFSFSDDGRKMFMVDNGLFELPLDGTFIKPARVNFMPNSLNITPDGDTVLLSNLPRGRVHKVDSDNGKEKGEITR